MNLISQNEARQGIDSLLEGTPRRLRGKLKLLLGAEILGFEDPRSRGDHPVGMTAVVIDVIAVVVVIVAQLSTAFAA